VLNFVSMRSGDITIIRRTNRRVILRPFNRLIRRTLRNCYGICIGRVIRQPILVDELGGCGASTPDRLLLQLFIANLNPYFDILSL